MVVYNPTQYDTYEDCQQAKLKKEQAVRNNWNTDGIWYKEKEAVILSKCYEGGTWMYRYVYDSGEVEQFGREEFIMDSDQDTKEVPTDLFAMKLSKYSFWFAKEKK